MIRNKSKNPIESYIKQMNDYGWEVKSEDSEYLVFEKEEPNGKCFQTFMKNGLAINFMSVLMTPIFIINIHEYYKVNFYYTVTSYWRIFMLFFSVVFLLMFLLICIGEINYLFRYRVNVCDDKNEYVISIKSIERRMKSTKIELIILLSLFFIGLITTIGANTLLKEDTKNVNLNLKLTELNDKIEGEIDNSLDISKTIFAQHIFLKQTVYSSVDKKYYTDRLEKGYLDIEYFFSDNKWVLNKGFDSIYNELNDYSLYKEDNNSQELKNWGAKKLFIGENKERIILYEDRVLAIDGDFDYTKENIDKILKDCSELKK